MGLTKKTDFPMMPIEPSRKWTIKRLFPVANIVSNILKTYNSFEIFFTLMIFITGVGELIGRRFSMYWYIIMLINLGGIFFIRYIEKQYGTGSNSRGV